jgi:Zn-dependent metalloprotease
MGKGKETSMTTSTHRCSIFCILPPHILRNAAKNSKDPALQQAALDTLARDMTFRSLRLARAARGVLPVSTPVGVTPSTPSITIFDAKGTEDLPGTLVASPHGSNDPAVKEAFAGLQGTYQFYWSEYERNSIDDHGLPLLASVHFGKSYDNAYWDGERMVFGDGDGQLFNRFTIAIDVIGHELTHGVTGAEVNLQYTGQSGALNESISDVFGSCIKQRVKNQTADQADWLIGEGLLTSKVQGKALRSMDSPGTAYNDPVLGKDPQPDTYKNYVHTFEDNGGVHINSGIPNRAFALAAKAIGGYSWQKAGRVWYETLRDHALRSNATFKAFATRTIANAGHLFGDKSVEQKAIADAWLKVGVKVAGTT